MTGTPAADTEADAITRRLTDDQRICTRLATIEQPREVGASLASERTGRLDSRAPADPPAQSPDPAPCWTMEVPEMTGPEFGP